MRIIFFSDIHGVPSALEKLLAHAAALKADKLVLLGDALYHGPRNGVPDFYDPVKVAAMLNAEKNIITAVRGNCDAEVDQMMLDFPIMGDYAELNCAGKRFFLTHGHLWNAAKLPPLPAGAILVHGHTHIPVNFVDPVSGITIFNPGSISLPKQQFPPSFGFFDGKELIHYRLEDGTELILK